MRKIEVVAETQLLDLILQIAIGGADQPDIDVDSVIAANPFDLAFFQHTQKVWPVTPEAFGDFVKEQGST